MAEETKIEFRFTCGVPVFSAEIIWVSGNKVDSKKDVFAGNFSYK